MSDETTPGPDRKTVTLSKAALLGLFSCAFMGDDFQLTHGEFKEILDVLGDDAVIPRREHTNESSDLPAVREFAAKHDPREEST